MNFQQQKPWEREGYGFSGPTDVLHDTKINETMVTNVNEHGVKHPDIGAAAVTFTRTDGEITVVSLSESAPDISAEDLQAIRQ